MARTQAVIGDDSPNTVRVGQTREQLTNELAAVTLALLDKREARTKANKAFNSDIKDLEKRTRELAQTIKSSGFRDAFQTEFGTPSSAAPGEDGNDGEN
jgi:hypothetical protein